MTGRGVKTGGWVLLGAVSAGAAYLLFELQLWADTPTWRAAVMAAVMCGVCWVTASALAGGIIGLYRQVAIAMLIGSSTFLLMGAVGPLVQALELTAVKIPLRVVIGATPPLILGAAVILMHGLPARRSAPRPQ